MRDATFIVGAETATIPTATTPTVDNDFISLGYFNANATGKNNVPLHFVLLGPINQTFENIDGYRGMGGTVTFTELIVTARNSGTGTTTVVIRRDAAGPSGSGSITAGLTGSGAAKSTKTMSLSLAVANGDMLYCDITAFATGLLDLTVTLRA